MSNNLAKKQCEPCRGGSAALTEDDSKGLLQQLRPGWKLVDNHHLSRTFEFRDFMDAIHWVNRLATIAEAEDHHPTIKIDFRKVQVDIWTHKIDGLTESDFILAAKADEIR
jgi:4a-hydroxytetrahydrobiopterin dehydratase